MKVIDGLSPKQRKAIYYMVVLDMDYEQVATKLDKKTGTIKGWLKNPVFAEALSLKFSELEDIGIKWRHRQNQMILDKLYEEIHNRVLDGKEVRNASLVTLMKMAQAFAGERRVDALATGKSGAGKTDTGGGLTELQERYAKASSAKVLKLKEYEGKRK